VAGVVTVLVELGLPLEIVWQVVYKWGGLGQHPLAVAYWTSPERRVYQRRFDDAKRQGHFDARQQMTRCTCCWRCGDVNQLFRNIHTHCERWNAEYPPPWRDVYPGTPTPRPPVMLKCYVGHVWRKPCADRRGVHPLHERRGRQLNPNWSVRTATTYGCGTASLWRRHFDLAEPVCDSHMHMQHYFDPLNAVTEQYPHMCESALWLTICNTADDATRKDAESKMDKYIGRGRDELLRLALRF
jgi:hypothetical protein